MANHKVMVWDETLALQRVATSSDTPTDGAGTVLESATGFLTTDVGDIKNVAATAAKGVAVTAAPADHVHAHGAVATSNVGAGDAGKLVKLDAAGKIAGRVLETDGTKLDALPASMAIPGTIGGTTPSPGTFTTLLLSLLALGAPQALSGAGAVDPAKVVTLFTSTGVGDALTLANGTVAGQVKIIMHVVDGGSGVMTPATKTNFTTLTLTAAYDWGAVIWDGSAWRPLAIGGSGGNAAGFA